MITPALGATAWNAQRFTPRWSQQMRTQHHPRGARDQTQGPRLHSYDAQRSVPGATSGLEVFQKVRDDAQVCEEFKLSAVSIDPVGDFPKVSGRPRNSVADEDTRPFLKTAGEIFP
jgi:hypothetical protein